MTVRTAFTNKNLKNCGLKRFVLAITVIVNSNRVYRDTLRDYRYTHIHPSVPIHTLHLSTYTYPSVPEVVGTTKANHSRCGVDILTKV